MQIQLLSEQEVVEDDQSCTQSREHEWLVSEGASSLVNVPECIGQHEAAQRDQVSVDTRGSAAKRCQVARDCV